MRSIRMTSFWRLAAVSIAASLFVVACAGSTSTPKSGSGGTVTFADQSGTFPNYILPLVGGSDYTVYNQGGFSWNMYLPVYWIGQAGQPVLNKSLSVANPPVFSDNNTVVTITMKHWIWSNGQPVTARDVIFWMNLLSAVTDPNAPAIGSTNAPGPSWGASIPGGFPENVVSYKQTGTYSLVLHLNQSYNPTWYLYSELSQLHTIPQQSWDKLSSSGAVGSYDTSAAARSPLPNTTPTAYTATNPGTATTGALGVAQFLNTQSQDLATYPTNPLWKVVDGPFVLSQYTSTGFVKMVPNKDYSGTPKPTISAFEELPFTSDTAEFDALRSGSLTIGYIPTLDLAQKTTLEKQEGYSFAPWYDFGITYFPYNYTNTTNGPIFKQLYFRQAFQSLVDQPEYIKDFLAGIGTVTNGPVPSYPANNIYESRTEAKGEVYPYSPTKAVSLLKDNGWTVKPGSNSVCSKPGTASGDCGAGIKLNQPLSFPLLYDSGNTVFTNEMAALKSTMQSVAGIDLTLSQAPFAQVVGTGFNKCTYSTPCNAWSLVNWGGWSYEGFPDGGQLFSTGAESDGGDYSNSTDDANISATYTQPNSAAEFTALFKYEDYLAEQLPVVWMPNAPYQLTMYKSTLQGLVPQDIHVGVDPQFYSFKS
jgi:peptide/nickel transport system substrate-binding protein